MIMTAIIEKLIILISDFLERIGTYLEFANLKRSNYYIVPILLIAENLNDTIENIIEIIHNEDLGLDYVSNPDYIKDIEDIFTFQEKTQNQKYENELNTAFDILEHPEKFYSQDQVIHPLFQKKIKIEKKDFLKGLILVKDITKFAEIAVEYVGIDKITKIFDWKNFEEFIGSILKNFGFKILTNFRFSLDSKAKKSIKVISRTTQKEQKRFEIDVVGIRNKDILFIDVKFWSRKIDISSGLENAAKFQIERIKAFISDIDAVNALFQKFGSTLKKDLIKNLKKKQNDPQITVSFNIYPIIIHSGKSGKKLNSQGVPLISLSEFSEVFQDFTKNKSLFTSFKLKNFQIQSELL